LNEIGKDGEGEMIKHIYKESARAEKAGSSAYAGSLWVQVRVIMRRRVEIFRGDLLLDRIPYLVSLCDGTSWKYSYD